MSESGNADKSGNRLLKEKSRNNHVTKNEKNVCIMLGLIMIFALAGCGQSNENSSETNATAAETNENDDETAVYIGYPIWWGDLPCIVYNFLESYDFSGKTVIPFCTHGGSGLAGTVSTVTDLTGTDTFSRLAISGTMAQNDRDSSRSQVQNWLRDLGQIQ